MPMSPAIAPRTIDEYIAGFPPTVRTILKKVRATVRAAAPDAQEVISYQMPTFKIADGSFLCLGGWKEHYSLYPASDALVAAFKGALTPYRASKGTLRFPLSEPVPVTLIERIAKFQAKDAARRAKAKRARRRQVSGSRN